MDVKVYFMDEGETILMEAAKNNTKNAEHFQKIILLIDALCAGRFPYYHLYHGYRDDLISLLKSQKNGEVARIELTRDGIFAHNFNAR